MMILNPVDIRRLERFVSKLEAGVDSILSLPITELVALQQEGRSLFLLVYAARCREHDADRRLDFDLALADLQDVDTVLERCLQRKAYITMISN
jgi:hypothetical protein